MKSDRFKELLDELDGNSLQTLKEKNARYSTKGDCLHNFRSGAEVAGGTPAQACWGYMTKHLVALRDMVQKNDFSNREDFLEKCQDTINYVRFLWCIGNDDIVEEPKSPLDTIYKNSFATRDGAERFIRKLEIAYSKHGILSWADVKGICGYDDNIFPEDHKIGWKSMDNISCDKSIVYNRGMYIVILPDPIEI